MPTLPIEYITVPEYAGRFGVQECILCTNDTAPGPGDTPTYDSAKIEVAIQDGTEIVEGYIGVRYTVPLASVPRIVKGWVADLAREKLFTFRAPDAVIANANVARSQLKDVSIGKLSLPIEDGTAPPTAADTGTSQTSGDAHRPTITRSRMAAYMDGIGGFGGDCTPNWRR